MKRLFLLMLLLAILGGALGLVMLQDPGYALFTYHDTAVEMSLWVAASLWLLSLISVTIALDLLFKLFGISQWLSQWSSQRRHARSMRLLALGMRQLETGSWVKAERVLLTAARLSPQPLPAYLAAAKAAQRLHAFDRSEKYLVLAEDNQNQLAVGLARARLLLDSAQWENAALQLRLLVDKYPHEAEPVKLLLHTLAKLKHWGELADLLPQLRRRAARHDEQAWTLELHANQQVIQFIAQSGTRINQEYTRKRLDEYFKALPRKLRDNDELLASYADALLSLQTDEEVERMLRERLRARWNARLVELYGRAQSGTPRQALDFAESLVPKHPHEPALMLALGRLCLQNREWGRAREYLESSLALKKSPEAYAELIRLLVRLNDHQAHRYLIDGLQLLATELPELPLP